LTCWRNWKKTCAGSDTARAFAALRAEIEEDRQ
jgi:hypothetical protein